MCINWTKQLNWGWDPYFVRGVKTEMSYIAVNEVKSTTINKNWKRWGKSLQPKYKSYFIQSRSMIHTWIKGFAGLWKIL